MTCAIEILHDLRHPMTVMSGLRGRHLDEFVDNRAKLLTGSRLARPVHRPLRAVFVLLLPFALVGCVIPPSLSVAEDAGLNAPPAITSIRSDQVDLPEPGPVTFAAGAGTINVEVLDPDVADKLFVRVFFNYEIGNPTAPRAASTAAATGEALRKVTCDVGALCLAQDIPNREDYTYHGMTVQVFDREPLETGTPRFKAMPDGGLSTSWFFYLDCVDPT
jgi:hypothetical protein